MKVGFIGTGSMGSLLIDTFLRSGALEPCDVLASNRSQGKLLELQKLHPGLNVCASNCETASGSDIVFLCVKPLQFKALADEIAPCLRSEQIVVSITSPVQLQHLESVLPSKIAKIIPSITHSVRSGTSLCIFGSRLNKKDRLSLLQLFSCISVPAEIPESHTRIASDFSSCGPAFLSYFLERWIEAAIEATGIDEALVSRLAGEMLLGTGRLLTEGSFTPRELQERVAVRGGITAEALNHLHTSLEGVFERLITTTHDKYDEDVLRLDALFGRSGIAQGPLDR
ncbi:competence protein [Paenibacillus sp. FSL R7-0273]|uniref:late competence protein ComER n=1 Tax=Paenibacillus sp. FSL R7-0273 TaxID=1536772 RepID=UPI0004F7A832|nr:late competence protein ComER [Paenibacillus sp. FSL R7-0273]AIQ48845.1 competence protein [Paenibacillus sp. FSL R7-0273]OMF91276.1 late competence protein ComER [Paenibacillus sp. FSL R7-0273]